MARKHPYRREDGMAVVDVTLSDIRLLFSQLDPSPVREKDLDPSTEAYIMGAIRELGGGRPLVKIVFHVPADQFASLDSTSLVDSIRHYFSYGAWAQGQALKAMGRTAWISLVIGLSFLFACLAAREFLVPKSGMIWPILQEGLLIIGWVAMWRPLELILYDWWPIWRRRQLYRYLTSIPIEFVAGGRPAAQSSMKARPAPPPPMTPSKA